MGVWETLNGVYEQLYRRVQSIGRALAEAGYTARWGWYNLHGSVRDGEYRVELGVHNDGALPAGTRALKERLREIMPAHLDWALVIPTRLNVPTRTALGPRIARTAPPMYRAQLPAGRLGAAAVVGMRSSTVALPMRAYQEEGG